MNVAEKIFTSSLEIMKGILDLGEYKLGGDKQAFRYYKKVVMDLFYQRLYALFSDLEKDGLLKRCSCKSSLRNGYTDCSKCHGAGFVS